MDTRGYKNKLQERADKYREVPRYSTILHDERIKLGLSLLDYCIIDGVHNLSHKPNHPYCTAPKESMAAFMGVSRATVFNSLKKGLGKGLLEKNDRGDLRTTEKWIHAVVLRRVELKRLMEKR